MIKVIGLIVILLGFSCSTQSQQQTQLDEVEENSEQGNADDTSSDSEGNSNNSSNNNEYDENSTNSNDSEGNSAADESSEETGDSSEDYAGGDEGNYGESENAATSNQLDEYEANTSDDEDYESNIANNQGSSQLFNAEGGGDNGESINSVNEANENIADQNIAEDESYDELNQSSDGTDTENYDGASEDLEEAYDVLPVYDQLVWVGHHIDYKNRRVKIKILTKGNPTFEIFQELNRSEQPELVVRFFETNLRNKIKWDINASEFHSPVAYIRPRLDEYNGVVDVVLTVRDNVKPQFLSENSNITLTFPIPKRYNGEAIVSDAESATEDVNAINLTGVNLTPDFEDNSELPNSLSYLAESDQTADEEGVDTSNVSNGVDIDEVMTPESSYDSEGLPANFNEGSEDDGYEEIENGSEDNLLNYLEPVRQYYFLTVAQENVYEPNSSDSGEQATLANQDDGFSNLNTGSQEENLNSASEAYETNLASEQTTDSAQDVQPGLNEAQSYGGNVLSIEFVDSELGLVLQTLHEETGINFIIPSDLRKTKVTVNFKNVPWDEALKAILEAYQLGMVKVGETIVRIDEIKNLADYITELQKIKNIEIQREPTKVLVMRLNSSLAKNVTAGLTGILANDKILDQRINISSDERTNSIVVEAPERILAKIKNIVKRLDIETPQVEIASRIVSVSKNNTSSFGVAWTGAFNYDPGRGLSFGALNFPNSIASNFSVDPGVSTASSAGATRLKFGSINNFLDLDLFLKMEEQRGSVNVLQSNKVIVLDGQKANVLQGSTQYFRLLAPAGAGATAVPQLTEVQFNLELDVTPRISADGNVQMNLKVTSDSPSDTSGDQAANKNTKSVTTNMMRRSGETGVIGGIYDTIKQTSEVGIPFFSDLPIIGVLFKSTTTRIAQQEFLVMVTPKVLERSNFDGSYNESSSSGDAYESTSENVYDANDNTNAGGYEEAEENFQGESEEEFANTSDPSNNNYEGENTAENQSEEGLNESSQEETETEQGSYDQQENSDQEEISQDEESEGDAGELENADSQNDTQESSDDGEDNNESEDDEYEGEE